MSVTRPPEPVIRGRKTWLRPPEPADIPAFVRWFNDYGTVRYIGARAPMGTALEERWFEGMLERHGTSDWYFVICRLGSDRAIGNMGLHGVDLTNGSAAVGITIGETDEHGKGLGTDALEALLDFGFGRLRLERMWLDVYDFNGRAIASYRKAGLQREGVARHGAYRDGRFVDVVAMAILRDEWAARRATDAFPGAWPPERPGEVTDASGADAAP
jgi:RimJ/RimL family protein N-acetyltransferase